MEKSDFELLLFDRLDVIRKADEKYNLTANAYLSFSGGKDSTVLHHLLDMALPNNKIPRVYIDTGIEYNDVRKFVFLIASYDSRIKVIRSGVNIKNVLETYGYPFKSKQHSHNVALFQHSGVGLSVKRYLGLIESNTLFRCPLSLGYQFTSDFNLKVSDECCHRLKKIPVQKWEKENGRRIAITGMRRGEGGQRASIKGCVITDKDGIIKKFHPLLVVGEDFEDIFIEREHIKLCDLYYPPYNFKRTGCKGCPFALDLQDQLTLMDKYLPLERTQCEYIWGPVYKEYRRVGYRLKRDEQLKLF